MSAIAMPSPCEARSRANMAPRRPPAHCGMVASMRSAIGEHRRALGHERRHALEVVGGTAELGLQRRLVVSAAPNELPAASIAARVAARARAGIATSRCARVATSASKAASSTHFQIRPSRSASSAVSLSPSIARPSAVPRPTSRGSSQVPPQSGTRPILANAWMKLAERRGDHQVAAEGEVGAGAGGDAVDRGDHRHRHRAHAQRQRLVEALDRGADVGRLAARLEVRRDRRIGQVLAGAEAPAAAGEDDAAHGRIGGGRFERGGELGMHRRGEAVERFRAIEGQRPDAGLIAHQDERFFHGCVSSRVAAQAVSTGRHETNSTDR